MRDIDRFGFGAVSVMFAIDAVLLGSMMGAFTGRWDIFSSMAGQLALAIYALWRALKA